MRRPPSHSVQPLTAAAIDTALEFARLRLREGEWYPCNTYKLNDDFESLHLSTSQSQLEALQRAANEVSSPDFEEPEAPGLADEPACRKVQMIPFVWNSRTFGAEMYFKFGIHHDGHLVVFSLHKADFSRRTTRRR